MTDMKISTFDSNAREYDDWFHRHPGLFQSECRALEKAIPVEGTGIEIGVGTGRFAKALNIAAGVEPSQSMAEMAVARGIIVINAKAENLPLHSRSFDYAVMVTAVCFLEDIPKAFSEANRIINKNGDFVVGMIDRESDLGKTYESMKAANSWYKDAHFHSVPEIAELMQKAGFTEFKYWQTLFSGNEDMSDPLPGFGKGSFVVIGARKI